MKIRKEIKKIEDQIINWRRYFHQNPELGFEELSTAEKIFNGLTKSDAFELHFPKELTLILKLLRILPYKIYLYLIAKFLLLSIHSSIYLSFFNRIAA